MKLALKMGPDYKPDYFTDRGDFKVFLSIIVYFNYTKL